MTARPGRGSRTRRPGWTITFPGAETVGVPCTVVARQDLDDVLRTALRATPDAVIVVRPDGHLAAAPPSSDPGDLRNALRRACGR